MIHIICNKQKNHLKGAAKRLGVECIHDQSNPLGCSLVVGRLE